MFFLFGWLAILPVRVSGQGLAPPIKTVRITGRVIDSAGASAPETRVTLVTVRTNKSVSETQTNEDGNFTFLDLPAQAYELGFEKSGFELATRNVRSIAGDVDVGTVVLNVGLEKPYFVAPDQTPADFSSTPSAPIKTTLCDLVKHANRSHGGYFQVRARIYPGGIDTSDGMYDTNCPTEFSVFMPDGSSLNPFDKSLDKLGDARLRQYLSRWQTVEATITGKFELRLFLPGKSYFTFTLLSVSDVTARGSRR
jgi:hypothetical protein